MSASRRASVLPALAIACNATLWGLSWWPLHHLHALGLHPLWTTALLYALPALALLLWCGLRKLRDAFARHRLLWALMLAAGVANACFNWAVTIGDVIRVVLLFYLMPVWSALLAWWWLGEKPGRSGVLRVALALCGVALVMQPAGAQWRWPLPQSLPDVLAIAGGLGFACTNVLLRKIQGAEPQTRALALFSGSVLMGGALALFLTGSAGVSALPAPGWGWMPFMAGMSLVFALGSFALQYGAARLSAHTLSLIMLLEVLVASASSIWLGAASLSAHVLAGGALVMAAALLAALHEAQ